LLMKSERMHSFNATLHSSDVPRRIAAPPLKLRNAKSPASVAIYGNTEIF